MNRQLMNRLEQLEEACSARSAVTIYHWEDQSQREALAAYMAQHPEAQGAAVDFVQFRWLRADEEART